MCGLLLQICLLTLFMGAMAHETKQFSILREEDENRQLQEQHEEKSLKPLPSKSLGSYTPVDDLRSSDLLDAAKYAIQELLLDSDPDDGTIGDDGDTVKYSFLPFEDEYVPRILQASQQVVAGVNWNMTIMILLSEDQDVCIGAFGATIYNHFGDLAVKHFGKEVTCDVAYQMVEEQDEKDRTRVYSTPEDDERERQQELESISSVKQTSIDTSSFEDSAADALQSSSSEDDMDQFDVEKDADMMEEDRQEQRVIVGGYSPVQDLGLHGLLAAADFAFTELMNTSNSDALPTLEYSFLPLVRYSTDGEEEGHDYEIRIIDASQQVVSGMNYKMTIMIEGTQRGTESDCVGSFSVTVYDHFGQYSVTRWGPEVACERTLEILKERAHHKEEALRSQDENASSEEVSN